jgi:hypothetical protein
MTNNRIHIINLRVKKYDKEKTPSGKFSDNKIKWSDTNIKFSKKV